MTTQLLAENIQIQLGSLITHIEIKDMVTIEVMSESLLALSKRLLDDDDFYFEQLVDLCGVDYSDYGYSCWRTEETTLSGFSRGVERSIHEQEKVTPWNKPRFGVIYHLLSLKHNHRLRMKVYVQPEPLIPSVIDIWPSANWYEREAFDLFGIVFEGHPDLRRLLTDYGFKGHPFRKDYPLIGELEMRYDAEKKRCIYEPVSINPRVLVPKVIREDTRYIRVPNDEGNPHVRNS